MAAQRRGTTEAPDGSENRLRCGQPLRLRARLRSAPRQHHHGSRPARLLHTLRHDLAVPRLVPRPPHRVRVRRQPVGREARCAGIQRRQRGLRLGRGVGRRHPRRFSGVDGGIPHPAVAAALRAGTEPHVRLNGGSRSVPLRPARELAPVPPVEGRVRVAIRRGQRVRRPRGAAPSRGRPLRGDQERVGVHPDRHRPHPGRDARRRREVPRRIEPHPRRDVEPRLRTSGGRPGGLEPHGLRNVLQRAAPVFRRRTRPVPVRRELQQRQLQRRRAGLQPAHRARARAGRHLFGHHVARLHASPRRRQAHRSPAGRADDRRARGRDGTRDGRRRRDAVHYYQRPDAGLPYDRTRTSLSGDAEELQVGKVSGEHLLGQTSYQRRSAGFETNDLGYLQRADQQSWSTWIGYFDRHERALYRRLQWNINWWQYWTAAGLPEERAFNTNTHITFRNTWSFHAGGTLGQLGETYCYSCSRGGPAVRQDPYLAPWAGVVGDDRQTIVPFFWVNYWRGDGGRSTSLNLMPEVDFKLASRVTAAIIPNYTRTSNEVQPLGPVTDTTIVP